MARRAVRRRQQTFLSDLVIYRRVTRTEKTEQVTAWCIRNPNPNYARQIIEMTGICYRRELR